ncbi:hypothetical protein FJZ19_05110 [Candidatus Pacearchaeota archaeon]|nr:hypothetical protein [Candidatus Pacearchaeota archaeon]
MTNVAEILEERLRQTLADTLDSATSRCAVVVAFNERVFGNSEQTRVVIGVPYKISNHCLVIGSYLKDIASAPPQDYEERKKVIPINMIVDFRRINF